MPKCRSRRLALRLLHRPPVEAPVRLRGALREQTDVVFSRVDAAAL